MTDSGTEADGFNFTEIKGCTPEALRGGKPEPIRKRGYHRALKRGELWALSKKAFKNMIKHLSEQLYTRDYKHDKHWKESVEMFGRDTIVSVSKIISDKNKPTE